MSGARPSIDGALTLPQLDVTPYMPVAPEAATSTAGVPAWSTERIDLSALSLVDASFALDVGELTLQDIEISDAAMTVELVNSRLEANLTGSLYEGTGNAIFVANARTATPSFRIFADLQSIAALPLLEAAAGFDRLSGTGRLNIDLLTSGNSQAELMNGLGGAGSFAFADGAIRGVNLAQAIRGIESALTNRRLPEGFGDQEETDFSALEGTFTVANGVATNNDLIMLSPLVRVDGAGTVGIGQQTLITACALALLPASRVRAESVICKESLSRSESAEPSMTHASALTGMSSAARWFRNCVQHYCGRRPRKCYSQRAGQCVGSGWFRGRYRRRHRWRSR
ncbi:AsmA family protein [Hyphobacterium sp. CCMP332]|uniref:AsmA family protein n=1 Tax=Hyphobacterium sp. CCMP332 TaxID=2749086 RepID=UPI0016507763|nr:AsmA family protein [Hyphobacterium sp. CCMP332]QNL19043.1 AsmA family protein [Hyphobacterium sp. CCMP332]